MQLFAVPSKDELAAAAIDASLCSVKLCEADARVFDLVEHQRWSVEAVRVPLLLNVSAPETRGSYLKKHTTFLVTKEPHVDGVRRRFSDFEWLRFVLHARYTGLLIPSLPDKTAPVLKGDAFLASRMRGLQRFLNAIVSSPYLRSDAAVASFLDDMGDETAWLTARKETAVLENAGPGHMRWLQRILCEHIASSPESEIAGFKRHVEQRERLLSELAACAKRLADKSVAIAKDVGTLHAIFAGWKLAESGTASPGNDASFVDLLSKSTTAISGWSQVVHFQPAIYELLLLENVKYMLHQTTDMKQLLVEREQALTGTASPPKDPSPPSSTGSASSPSTLSFSAAASFSSAASSASQLASRFMSAVEPPAVALEEQQRRMRHASELMTRALMAEEMQRFRSETSKALEDFTNHFACAEAQMTKRSGAVWREYLKASSADQQALAQSTKQILDSALSSSNASPSAEAS